MALLEVNNLCISFGGLRAVDDFHISTISVLKRESCMA